MAGDGNPNYREDWESPKHKYWTGESMRLGKLEVGSWFSRDACTGYVLEQRRDSTVVVVRICATPYSQTTEWVNSIRVDTLRRPAWRVL